MAGGDRDEVAARVLERNAEHLFAVLGELKGGAMKLGQALSVYEAMIPAEFAEPYQQALTRLQAQGPSMPVEKVHRVLDEQLGRAWRKHFRDFDDAPAAAASIGQVHRGISSDGREVAVKIQYPGADVALQVDLKQLERFSRLFALVVPGLDARSLVREVRDRMLEELDYHSEAEHQRRFATEFADDPHVRVPAVLASAPKVIVSEWLDGPPLSAMIRERSADEPERDRIARIVVELLFSSPARTGLLHADPHRQLPHFGRRPRGGHRFRLLRGAARRRAGGARPHRALRRGPPGRGNDGAAGEERFVTGDVPPEDVLRWLGALADPLRTEQFHFTREWIGRQGLRVANPNSNAYRQTGRSLNLPAEHMLVARVTGGWMNILAQLDCRVRAREIAQQWLAGFADP